MDSKTKEELSEIIDDYASIPAFIKEYNNSSAPEFDYYVVNKMSLFLLHNDFDFVSLEGMARKLEKVLPSFQRIFAKPIIQLIDEDEILPIESARIINNASIQHILSHSELWNDINDDGILPNKLLTRTYKDNYSIYENILFARTVNCILSYLHKNMRQLKSVMYTSDVLEFNLLERLNHLNYYLAIGKLHTGYVRDFGKYYDKAKSLYKRLDNLEKVLSARLKRNVYRYNRDFKGEFRLHNSNILHMHKDYHKVYLLYKHFDKSNLIPREISEEEYRNFQKDYMDYIMLISVFSILNFNFEAKKDEKIDFSHPNVHFSFHEFQLHLSRDRSGNIVFDFKKDKDYRLILFPGWSKKKFGKEGVSITPFESEKESLYLSISDVESFRRIDQLLYRGMIYSDVSFDRCAFCGNEMKKISEEGEAMVATCNSCNAKIEERRCSLNKETYYVSSIQGFHPDFDEEDNSGCLHYRNITSFSKGGEAICPLCNKVHPE